MTPELIRLFVVPLNEMGVEYMVTGATAAIIYGEPRLTRDIDMVTSLRLPDAARFHAAFPEPDFYLTPQDVIEDEIRRSARGHFDAVHVPTSLKADFYLASTDPLHAWAMERRHAEVVGETTVQTAPLEYVIARKLEWFREGGSAKHIDDIRSMLRVSGDRVDRAALDLWIERLRLVDEWRLVASNSS